MHLVAVSAAVRVAWGIETGEKGKGGMGSWLGKPSVSDSTMHPAKAVIT